MSMTASDAVSKGLHAMQIAKSYDEDAETLYEQLVEIDSLLNDFNHEIAIYKEGMEFSEEEYYHVEERLNLWNHLKSKYGKSYTEILKYQEESSLKINKLTQYEEYLEALKSEIGALEVRLSEQAIILTNCRVKHSKSFSAAIKSELQELNFLDIKFEIQITEIDHIRGNGKDNVEFMVSMNPGEEVKSLSNVVSGGELSRIMLAIKTALADKEEIETLIFDEVDAGISGKTATKVGEKLAIIAKSRQVICITHLAQIAALANEHFVIEKQVVEGTTNTYIHSLSEEESIQELARILGGGKLSDAIVKSAMEMKELAK